MKTNQCDRKRIDNFFWDEQADADIEMTQHLETCEECRFYFDSQAAQSNLWLEAQQMLRPSEYDLASSAEFSGGGQGARARQSTPSIQAVLDSLAPSDDPDHLGRVGTYEVSGVVGAGGMGVVLKALDPSLDRVVAIKVLAPHLANNGTARKRFSREAKAAAAVLHPNVVSIHSVSSDAAFPYLVMAYVRGGSVQKRLNHDGPLSTIEILRIGSQVAAGLAAAHEQGLIHRDIKPENILLEEGVERVTLTDFGLARAVDDTSVTREGTIAGTPQYMSPEQARGEAVDQRSDLFSLGSVLYTLCTGSPPFTADSSYGVMRKISDQEPTPILERNPDIPAWLVCIIEKLMAKKKVQRFNSAAEVHELLEACLNHMQQPGVVKLPAWLDKKQKLTFGRHLFAGPLSITLGLFSMLTLITAIILGICFFQGVPESPSPANQTDDDVVLAGEVLGNGYVRRDAYIYFDGQRIDQAGKENIDEFAKFTELDLKLSENVDAASFKALSEEYTKDKNKVYYKWISPGHFWVVELPQADVLSFEVLGFNFAKDNRNVWWYGRPLQGIDPSTVELVKEGFVWKDAKNVWYQHEKIPGADAATFRHLDQGFYRDENQVYWSGSPLHDADPDTFRTFGDDSPFGADRENVWKGSTKVSRVHAASFEAVHQSIYKDNNGVYANGYPVENADPKSFRKVVELDDQSSALLADEHHYYVFLPYRGEIYLVTHANDSLKVKRQIWELGTPQHRTDDVKPMAVTTAELDAAGWRKQNVALTESGEVAQLLKDQEAYVLDIYQPQFTKAWEILSEGPTQVKMNNDFASEVQSADANLVNEAWRTDIVAFEKYLGELATAGRVPDKLALAKRVTIIPGSGKFDSEVLPVTDGAGGLIDLKPAEDTVQFQVNKALKDQTVSWEFELGRDTSESFGGVVTLTPKSVQEEGGVPFLSTLLVHPAASGKSSFSFIAGDIVKLKGTIGDFADNKGIGALQSPTGPIAIYHLDAAPHTVFWIGLSDFTIVSNRLQPTPPIIKPSADVTALAKRLLRATFQYDEQALATIYASEVRLLPGNRLFQFGLEVPEKMSAFGVAVERDKMLPALNRLANRDPIPGAFVDGFVDSFQIEQLAVSVGEFVTKPNQPSDSLIGELGFTIEENDVLLKVSVPGAFRYLQVRKSNEEWKVVAEY